jgi:hypothetical protein
MKATEFLALRGIFRCALRGGGDSGILKQSGTVRWVPEKLLWVTTVIAVDDKGNHAQSAYLDKLAEELTHRGLEAWVMAPPGRVPSVYVVNPAARALEDNVYCDRGKDGLCWFWWSWAERISIADDLDAAATAIARVLALPRD